MLLDKRKVSLLIVPEAQSPSEDHAAGLDLVFSPCCQFGVSESGKHLYISRSEAEALVEDLKDALGYKELVN